MDASTFLMWMEDVAIGVKYTDSRHTPQYNIVLAKRRAHSVSVILMKKLGNKLMRNVKIEIDKKAFENVPHNDPNAVDFKKAQ